MKDTSTIHVRSSLNIIQSIRHTIQAIEKLGIIDFFGSRRIFHTILMRNNVQRRIHHLGSFGSTLGLQLLHIPGAEQKLSIQITLFNGVHICHSDFPTLLARNPHHGPIFQHLTTNRTCTHQKNIASLNLLLKLISKHTNLTIITTLSGSTTLFIQIIGIRKTFQTVEIKPLLDRCKFSTACFNHLLGRNPPNHGIHGSQFTTTSIRKCFQQFLVNTFHTMTCRFFIDIHSQLQEIASICLVMRARKSIISLLELMQRLDGNMILIRSIQFRKVRSGKFRSLHRSLQREETMSLRHFHLSSNPSTDILSTKLGQ
eukprot:Sdes_comp20196_c0_seq1m13488